MLSLFRSVTQRSPDKREIAWRKLMTGARDALVNATFDALAAQGPRTPTTQQGDRNHPFRPPRRAQHRPPLSISDNVAATRDRVGRRTGVSHHPSTAIVAGAVNRNAVSAISPDGASVHLDRSLAR